MRKYKIPAEVNQEDRIFGPITMRRLIILCLGGGITWLFYMKLGHSSPVIWFPPVFFFGSLTLAFAFIEPFGMRFGKFILRMIEFIFLPKKRIWDKRFSQDMYIQYQHIQHQRYKRKQKSVVPENIVLKNKQAQRKKIEEFSHILDEDLSTVDLSLYEKSPQKKNIKKK